LTSGKNYNGPLTIDNGSGRLLKAMIMPLIAMPIVWAIAEALIAATVIVKLLNL
jgi:hypothetical protein